MSDEEQPPSSEEVEEDQPNLNESNKRRLGKSKPSIAVLQLSVGPILQNLALSLYGVIESIYVSNSIGPDGLATLGQVFAIEFFGQAISEYLAACVSTRLSYLIGLGKTEECSQLYIDFLRIAVIFSLLVVAIVLPITKPLSKWFGADDKIADNCFNYMLSMTIGNFIMSFQYINSNVLQAIGRSGLYGLFQSLGFLLNIGLFDPIFLFGFKLGVWSLSLATIISNLIASGILFVLIFKGKFYLQPNLGMFLKKPTSETWHAMKVGLSTLVAYLSTNLPGTVLQKFFLQSATRQGVYNYMAQEWALITRIYQITCSIAMAISIGSIPLLSFAYGASLLKRFLKVAGFGLLYSTVAATVLSLFVTFLPKQVASIWNDDPVFLEYAGRAVPISMCTGFSWGTQYMAFSVLQSMKKVAMGLAQSVLTQVIPLPTFAVILYYTNKDDPVRILFSYVGNDIFSLVVSLLFMIKPLKICLKAPKDEGEEEDVQPAQLESV